MFIVIAYHIQPPLVVFAMSAYHIVLILMTEQERDGMDEKITFYQHL